ncbi:PEP-CTERM sorting domain-containing protein [Geobacter pickeringii]|uniref:Ice-binding protein C-terminal domain-containing protein n=1 Tax=Geobacter pickeringii TaxID=345632 RepID=A0A0B5BBH3_9BACT|nr:PEP-CTERM sorting domain-containing protein [Geobacter pickeringii]AJE03882.1 hypothetical protein GPICK_11430 [Geobacter pickeringii]
MRCAGSLAAVLTLAFTTAAGAASFINGGFELGDFNGWTKGGGAYYGYYSPSGDPGKSAVVTAAPDPRTGGALNSVYQGTYSARVNNYDPNYHYSTLTQQVLGWSDPSIYFAWAAVIEDPGHPNPGHVRVTLHDDTANTSLYDVYVDYYNQSQLPGGGAAWHTATSGWSTWGYSDWQIANLDTSGVLGHNLTLTVLASDCAYGGHGGYAYFDGFGAAPPPPGPGPGPAPVPEPSTFLLLGAGLAVAACLRKRARS